MAEYRQNTNYNDIVNDEGEDEGDKVNHGNTRLPFGLCERYGIRIGKDWTPRDAWNALKGKGITPEQVYKDLGKNGKVTGTEELKESLQDKIKRLKIDTLGAKERREIFSHIKRNWNLSENRIISQLRFYTGSFGDLSQFSDEELKDWIKLIRDTKDGNETYHFKKGSKEYLSRNKDYLDIAGIKYKSEEENEKAKEKALNDILTKSQTEQDKDIQSMFNGATVCFGKGYDKDFLNEITGATKTLLKDYPELSNYVKRIGDRNNLEKYLNAVANNTPITEDEIEEKFQLLKQYALGYKDEELREKAKDLIKQGRLVKLTQANGAYAYWQDATKSLVFMGTMKRVDQSQIDSEYNSNFHPTNKKIGTYYHEMGHAIDHTVDNIERDFRRKYNYDELTKFNSLSSKFKNDLSALRSQNFNSNYKTEYDNLFLQRTGRMPTQLDYRNATIASWSVQKELQDKGIKQYTVSRYAQQNNAEFVAECFSAHYTNMNNPLASQVVELYKNYLKDLRGFKR